jgi:hypothetical protein
VLKGYISQGGRFSAYANHSEMREALHFTKLKTSYLDAQFNTDDLSVANAQRAHMLLALHRLSLENRVG